MTPLPAGAKSPGPEVASSGRGCAQRVLCLPSFSRRCAIPERESRIATIPEAGNLRCPGNAPFPEHPVASCDVPAVRDARVGIASPRLALQRDCCHGPGRTGPSAPLNPPPAAVDIPFMRDNVDRRLLDSWEQSRRHQDEARRFLARQRFPVKAGEARALDEIVATIADLERLRRSELPARRAPRPPSTRPSLAFPSMSAPALAGVGTADAADPRHGVPGAAADAAGPAPAPRGRDHVAAGARPGRVRLQPLDRADPRLAR